MSFADFSCYRFDFNRLDAKLKSPDEQKKYYDKWMQKYAKVFKSDNGYLVVCSKRTNVNIILDNSRLSGRKVSVFRRWKWNSQKTS